MMFHDLPVMQDIVYQVDDMKFLTKRCPLYDSKTHVFSVHNIDTNNRENFYQSFFKIILVRRNNNSRGDVITA